jgi:hypothetical protein
MAFFLIQKCPKRHAKRGGVKMILVYMEDGEHKMVEIETIETTINDDDLHITYFEGDERKEMMIEKTRISSINVKY